jgi:hypothetical protein
MTYLTAVLVSLIVLTYVVGCVGVMILAGEALGKVMEDLED